LKERRGNSYFLFFLLFPYSFFKKIKIKEKPFLYNKRKIKENSFFIFMSEPNGIFSTFSLRKKTQSNRNSTDCSRLLILNRIKIASLKRFLLKKENSIQSQSYRLLKAFNS